MILFKFLVLSYELVEFSYVIRPTAMPLLSHQKLWVDQQPLLFPKDAYDEGKYQVLENVACCHTERLCCSFCPGNDNHQAKGVANPIEALQRLPKKFQELAVVLFVEKYFFTPVSPGGNVVNGISKFNSQRSCHSFSWGSGLEI